MTTRTMTAAEIRRLHAERAVKGEGFVPSLEQCLHAAKARRLFDVDTASSGYDGLAIHDDSDDGADGEGFVLANWAHATMGADAPGNWHAVRIELI